MISEAHNIDCMEYMRTIPDGYFDLAQYVNKPMIFKSCTFAEFMPRKGFKCRQHLINAGYETE